MTDETEIDLENIQKNDTPPNEIADNQSDEKKSLLLVESSSSKSSSSKLSSSKLSSSKDIKSSKKKNIKKINHEKLTTPKIIPRHCLEKQDWINLLATPRKYSPCLNKNLEINTVYYYNLSQPTRYKIIAKLQDRTAVVPLPFTDELMHILADDHLSLEEVEKLFQNISKKKNNQKAKKTKCQSDIKPVQLEEYSKMSKDTMLCQYNIAEAFVKSILQHKNVALKKDLEDLVKVIQKRLTKTVDNNENLDKDGKVYQQILFLSQLIANWIAGVLEEVAEQNEEELKKECEDRRKRMTADVYDESDDDHEEVLINTEKAVDDDQEKNKSNNKREKFSSNRATNEQSADELINQNETETDVHDYDNIEDNTTDNKNDEDETKNNGQDNDNDDT